MTFQKVAKAYGLWLAGVISAAAALWFLYRHTSFELEPAASPVEGDDQPVDGYLPEPVYGEG